MHFVVNALHYLQGIQEARGGGAQKLRGLPGDQRAVGKLNRHGGMAGFLLPLHGGLHYGTVVDGKSSLLHEQLQLIKDFLGAVAPLQIAETVIVAADDFLVGGLTADFIVQYTVAYHIDAHVRG